MQEHCKCLKLTASALLYSRHPCTQIYTLHATTFPVSGFCCMAGIMDAGAGTCCSIFPQNSLALTVGGTALKTPSHSGLKCACVSFFSWRCSAESTNHHAHAHCTG